MRDPDASHRADVARRPVQTGEDERLVGARQAPRRPVAVSDVDLDEGHGQAGAEGLDVRLLARPEPKEGLVPLRLRHGLQSRVLRRRADPIREVEEIGDRSDPFEVQPDQPIACHGDAREAVGVRRAERDPARRLELGPAPVRDAIPDPRRSDARVAGEDAAQEGAPRDEANAVTPEPKPLGARDLSGVEQLGERFDVARRVHPFEPEVDLVGQPLGRFDVRAPSSPSRACRHPALTAVS